MKTKILILLSIPFFLTNLAYAQQIPVTLSEGVDKILFDGKWTFKQEWKATSYTDAKFDDGHQMIIRTGHDYENLYVLIDFISDTSIQRSADRGIVCIDSKMDRSTKPQSDDFCFLVALGSKNPSTLQGGSVFAQKGYWQKIQNHPEFVAVGGVSDENDRYSKIPHATYEFKIPLEVTGRSNMYGFYVGAYDANSGKEYSWPENITVEKYPFIPEPALWGELISPDKTIPEFGIPNFLLFSTIAFLIVLSRYGVFRRMRFT